MEFNEQADAAPPRPSATVVMLRDGAAGLEVFLIKRHGLSDVLGGAYVFPGGKVDAEDRDLLHRLDRPAPELHAALGEPDLEPADAAALFVAAVREVFEETGVLYAPVAGAQATQAWTLLREGRSFAETVAELPFPLAAGSLQP